jgi:hypothetical protein
VPIPTPEEVGRALDHATLLPDEDPASTFIDDALHWVFVYSELLEFKSYMIAAAKMASDGLTYAARQDVAIDQDLLGAQAARYQVRLAFWQERAATLSNGHSEATVQNGVTAAPAPRFPRPSRRGR